MLSPPWRKTQSPGSSSRTHQVPPWRQQHSVCSNARGAAAETPKHSGPVFLDQVLAKLGPASEGSLSCDALIKEFLENWDQQELPDREAAGDRDSKAQSAFLHPPQDQEGGVVRHGSRLTPGRAAGSQGPHSTAGLTKDSAGEAENSADILAHGALPLATRRPAMLF